MIAAISKSTWLYKFKASGIHFSLSAGIFSVFMYMIFAHWYPLPFFHTDGGWEGVRIMIGVDLVLGPVLTLIVFHPKKTRRQLLIDIGTISVIQLSALAWGGWTVYQQHPAVILHWEGRFMPVTPAILATSGKGVSDLDRFGPERPRILVGKEPVTKEELKQQLVRLKSGVHVLAQTELYRPLDGNEESLYYDQNSVKRQFDQNPDLAHRLEMFLKDQNQTADHYHYKYYFGRYRRAILVLDKHNKVVTLFDIGAS